MTTVTPLWRPLSPDPLHGGVGEVGGKAASLLRMIAAGLPVPRGAVLTTGFFAPWLAVIKTTAAWSALAGSKSESWPERCEALKAAAAALPLETAQAEALGSLQTRLEGSLFAVRSSSPEEDLQSASFAGGYETVLGVTAAGLESAVRRCFASSLDARVLRYKLAQGFDPFEPRIAVVVQTLVPSEVAGVGFSLNPLTNDYDEAVVEASWGLGESVVQGAVMPDRFVLDRCSGEILSRSLGSKQSSWHPLPEGGLEARTGYLSGDFCLADEQLRELARSLGELEALFGSPIDMEWCYSGGALFLLQARPITAWVPLPPEMLTPPGAPRRLYMDIALSGGLTINAPISAIGQSWMERFAAELVRTYLGKLPVELGAGDAMWFLKGGRMYQDLSNLLWLTGPQRLAQGMRSKDLLMAETIANVPADTYRSARRPSWVSWRMVLSIPRILWRLRRVLTNAGRAALAPARTQEAFAREVRSFEEELSAVPDASIAELSERHGRRVIRHVIEVTMPGMMIGLAGLGLAAWVVPARHKALGGLLQRGFEGNVVVDMGAALHRMSGLLEPADLADPVLLARRLEAGDLPDPRQMCMMADGEFDPGAARRAHVEQRRAAYGQLMSRLGFARRAILRRAYSWIESFGGVRDTPKHDYLLLFAAIRRRAMQEGRRFVELGRLDQASEVLDLTLDQIERARQDSGVDLRRCAAANTAFLRRLRSLVRAFPLVIDSRGRILRPAPQPERPGELRGQAISPGIVRGCVKVLNHPDEKPVRPGDVLVAHTTDPGWTPLFVNASAVVLEVGGLLQHGAVVAREYGKPCVGGVSRLLERLHDGQMVEVDGNEGVVRVLSEPPAKEAESP